MVLKNDPPVLTYGLDEALWRRFQPSFGPET